MKCNFVGAKHLGCYTLIPRRCRRGHGAGEARRGVHGRAGSSEPGQRRPLRRHRSHRPGIHLVLPPDLFFLHLFLFSDHRLFQSLIARSREKSWFLRVHKEDWDRLVNEAWLHRDVTTQLHQMVAEMTPLAAEVDNLRWREAEAHRDAEDAEKSFDDLTEKARRD